MRIGDLGSEGFFKGRTEWGEMIAESLVLAWRINLGGEHLRDSLSTVAFWVHLSDSGF